MSVIGFGFVETFNDSLFKVRRKNKSVDLSRLDKHLKSRYVLLTMVDKTGGCVCQFLA
jgi:hypothetical protein